MCLARALYEYPVSVSEVNSLERRAVGYDGFQGSKAFFLDDVISSSDPAVGLTIFQNLFGPNGLLRHAASVIAIDEPSLFFCLSRMRDAGVRPSVQFIPKVVKNGRLCDCPLPLPLLPPLSPEEQRQLPQEQQSVPVPLPAPCKLSAGRNGTPKEPGSSFREKTHSGVIGLPVYWWLFRQSRLPLVLLTALFVFKSQFLNTGSYVWLTYWTGWEERHALPATTPAPIVFTQPTPMPTNTALLNEDRLHDLRGGRSDSEPFDTVDVTARRLLAQDSRRDETGPDSAPLPKGRSASSSSRVPQRHPKPGERLVTTQIPEQPPEEKTEVPSTSETETQIPEEEQQQQKIATLEDPVSPRARRRSQDAKTPPPLPFRANAETDDVSLVPTEDTVDNQTETTESIEEEETVEVPTSSESRQAARSHTIAQPRAEPRSSPAPSLDAVDDGMATDDDEEDAEAAAAKLLDTPPTPVGKGRRQKSQRGSSAESDPEAPPHVVANAVTTPSPQPRKAAALPSDTPRPARTGHRQAAVTQATVPSAPSSRKERTNPAEDTQSSSAVRKPKLPEEKTEPLADVWRAPVVRRPEGRVLTTPEPMTSLLETNGHTQAPEDTEETSEAPSIDDGEAPAVVAAPQEEQEGEEEEKEATTVAPTRGATVRGPRSMDSLIILSALSLQQDDQTGGVVPQKNAKETGAPKQHASKDDFAWLFHIFLVYGGVLVASMYIVEIRLAIGSIVSQSLMLLFETCGALQAARRIHDELLSVILRAPFWLYDCIPLGVIVNRMSADIQALDVGPLYALGKFMSACCEAVLVVGSRQSSSDPRPMVMQPF